MLSKELRHALVSEIAEVRAESEDHPARELRDLLIRGTRGLQDYSDLELLEEYVGSVAFNVEKLPSGRWELVKYDWAKVAPRRVVAFLKVPGFGEFLRKKFLR